MNYNEEVEKQKYKKDEQKKKGEKSKIQMLKDVKIELNSRIIRRLRNEFDNRLIVIDEVHNIRKTDDNENKKVAINLELLVKSALNMRFLLLSATPMYNSYKEMIWLLNLMNTNDRRARIEVRDIFKKNGDFKDDGEEILTRKSTGYISFVRGENPYTFPYRVYPIEFAKERTFPAIKYPSYQMNLKKIKHEDKKRVLSLYLTKIGECGNCGKCQYCAYKYIIYNLRNKKFSITTKTGVVRDMPNFENMESFGYTLLQTPLESLIISYPIQGLKSAIDEIPSENISEDFSQGFSEMNSNEIEDEADEAPGPIEGPAKTPSVKSSFSERKESEEPEEVESESEEFIMKPKIKKPLIIQDSDDDTDELLKINKTAIDSDIEKNDSDDDTEELQKEIIREEKKNLKKKPLIIEDSSSSNKSETKEKSKTVTIKKPTMQVEISDNEESSKTLADNSNGTLVDTSNGTLVDSSNGTLVDSSNEKLPTNENSTKGGKGPSIDPHQLTGKIGLERMMNYVDEKSPPVKGDFEYKKTTLDHYGKIFSREHIGKYSSKIKSILDNIVNEKSGKVSEGVILIYSQYIDSGLIPMALALEEMGFTRYGQGVKPLFKNKPTEVVDVMTMKAPADKKKFMPARYAMITGETRLSPNNDFEVKGLTGEDNTDGNKVKVVLISKAGSEGIDFKFIRQVHILEPWYNMNRIEQIIGRAVRNFSHKDLPFEKRNVEIFMYGTILGDNKEEAADLYVYRVAEYKAIQIGKVTRVLKETAVDCLLNNGSGTGDSGDEKPSFSQEFFSSNLKKPIKQILSNGMELDNFKIGDAPFSPACDYMAQCNYDCRPDKDIDIKDLNKDTYNENFIVVNSEKILQRIRMLMKESFFYKKDVLTRSIRTPKEYPYVQIYSALTQLVEDENEFITDKYGRNGRLINIGDYYLFQPVELRDKNASIFDRSTPIDYKHEMINFEIKQNIVKPVIDKRNLNKIVVEEEEKTFPEGNRLIDEMKVNFDISRDFTKQTKVPRGDDNWYKHCGIVMRKMSKEYPESKEYIINYLVAHMIELLLFDEKLEVMNYLYSMEHIKKGTFEWFAKEYFDDNSITTNNFTAFIMYKLNKRMIMILNKSNKWVEAEPEDQREIASSKEAKEFLTMKTEDYKRIIGFIG
jgi:hypothetical protein